MSVRVKRISDSSVESRLFEVGLLDKRVAAMHAGAVEVSKVIT